MWSGLHPRDHAPDAPIPVLDQGLDTPSPRVIGGSGRSYHPDVVGPGGSDRAKTRLGCRPVHDAPPGAVPVLDQSPGAPGANRPRVIGRDSHDPREIATGWLGWTGAADLRPRVAVPVLDERPGR